MLRKFGYDLHILRWACGTGAHAAGLIYNYVILHSHECKLIEDGSFDFAAAGGYAACAAANKNLVSEFIQSIIVLLFN